MIKETYVSFETAKLLKEKGFDEKVSTHYLVHPSGFSEFFDKKDEFPEPEDVWLKCPTHQMAMKWLREVHNIHIDIFVTYKDGIPHYQWSVDNLKTQDTISETPCCNAYEEAVEAALKYSLENLI